MHTLFRSTIVAGVAIAACWIPLAGRSDTPLQTAALAWDRGDYVTALNTYLQILGSPAAQAAFDEIALQTGELFQTTELTTDGGAPAFSPDGKRFLHEIGATVSRKIRVYDSASSAKAIAELPGHGAAFSLDGTL